MQQSQIFFKFSGKSSVALAKSSFHHPVRLVSLAPAPVTASKKWSAALAISSLISPVRKRRRAFNISCDFFCWLLYLFVWSKNGSFFDQFILAFLFFLGKLLPFNIKLSEQKTNTNRQIFLGSWSTFTVLVAFLASLGSGGGGGAALGLSSGCVTEGRKKKALVAAATTAKLRPDLTCAKNTYFWRGRKSFVKHVWWRNGQCLCKLRRLWPGSWHFSFKSGEVIRKNLEKQFATEHHFKYYLSWSLITIIHHKTNKTQTSRSLSCWLAYYAAAVPHGGSFATNRAVW